MKAILKHDNLELINVIGAAALLDKYGKLDDQMQLDNIPIHEKVYMLLDGDIPQLMVKSLGLGLVELSSVLQKYNPDIVLIVGDRFDVLTPVISGALMNFIIAHTMGGEVSGTIDESIRHVITKFAHIHFPANIDASDRIIKLDENPKYVFNVGCPRMDYIKEMIENFKKNLSVNLKVSKSYSGVGRYIDYKKEKFLLVSHHPVTTEFGTNHFQIEEILFALAELEMPTIMLWPNADSGSEEIARAIRSFREKHKPNWLYLIKNLPFDIYIELMFKTLCIIGNSSSAVREGAFIGTPSVEVGSRQFGRLKGNNIIQVKPNKKEIVQAIKTQLAHGIYKSENLYGDGQAGKKIANILSDLNPIDYQKKITY